MEVKALKFGGLTAKRPIVQGGMGVGVSLSSLAGNVAKCGGIGTISGVHPDISPDSQADLPPKR